jgi:hypothetical protein
MTTENCKDWTAILDTMPPRKPRLRVNGKCTFPTPGYKVVLRLRHPQGFNPKILMLDKVVTPPTGIEPQVVTTIDVSYHQETDVIYSEVEILPDGAKIKVEVVS